MYRIWILDDEPVFLKSLHDKIAAQFSDVRIRLFSSADQVPYALEEAGAPDILFMDIELGRTNGISLADMICAASGFSTKVIYFTAYGMRYCQEIFVGKTRPIGYLTKPIDDTYLMRYLTACMEELGESGGQQDLFSYQRNRVVFTMPYRLIYAFESTGHTVMIHDRLGRTDRGFLGKLDDLEQELPEDFLRVHKSYIVHMGHIARFDKTELLLRNDEHVPISRNKITEARNRYLLYRGMRL